MDNVNLLPATSVLKRYGISDMTLFRWLRDDALAFPQPLVINRRRYFRVNDLEAFEARQANKAAA